MLSNAKSPAPAGPPTAFSPPSNGSGMTPPRLQSTPVTTGKPRRQGHHSNQLPPVAAHARPRDLNGQRRI